MLSPKHLSNSRNFATTVIGKKRLIGFLALFAFAAVASNASTITFTLDQDGCSGTCGAGPYATVTLTDAGTGASAYVIVTETLSAGEVFARSSGKEALEFNVQVSAGTIAITNISDPASFGAATGSIKAPPFGSFYSAVTCLKCSGGNSNNPSGPLTFDVTDSATGVTTADFVVNSSGYYFASDIRGANGKTGDVAANSSQQQDTTPFALSQTTAAPEPGSLLLTFAGAVTIWFGVSGRRTIPATLRH